MVLACRTSMACSTTPAKPNVLENALKLTAGRACKNIKNQLNNRRKNVWLTACRASTKEQKKVESGSRDRPTGLLYFTSSFLLYRSDGPNTTKCDSLRREENYQTHCDITFLNNEHTYIKFL